MLHKALPSMKHHPPNKQVRESKNIDKWFPRINITSRKAGFIWVARHLSRKKRNKSRTAQSSMLGADKDPEFF